MAGEILLDAMPYVDAEYNDQAVKDYVDQLVADELKTMKASKLHPDIGSMPPKSSFEKSWFLKTEQRRVELGHAMKAFDGSRYAVQGPKPDQQTTAGWEAANRNAIAQNEMQMGRIMNLEMLNQFGQNSWKRYTEILDGMQKQVADSLAVVQEQIQEVNSERRTAQVDAGVRLGELETEWRELTYRNYQIQQAIQGLEARPVTQVMTSNI